MVSGVASGSTPSSYDVAPTITCRGTTVMSRCAATADGSSAVESVTSATVRGMGRRLPSREWCARRSGWAPRLDTSGGNMRIVIAGGHGQIALLLEKRLAERGDQAVGIVRNPDHVEDVEATGAEA